MKRSEIAHKWLHSLAETSALAEALACLLQGGEVLALEGDLGAGKTSFTRELTHALGCSRLANSPTFSLFQRYRGGRLPVLHGDFYRLGSPSELEDLGWEEMLHDFAQGLVVVEWADRFPAMLPSDRLHLVWSLVGDDDEERQVQWIATGPKSEAVLDGLRRNGVLP